MKHIAFWILVLSPITVTVKSQGIDVGTTVENTSIPSDDLYKKYLSDKNDIPSKIEELKESANEDAYYGRIKDALRKFQIAIQIEKQLKAPEPVSVDLYLHTGLHIGYINRVYALPFYLKAVKLLEEVQKVSPDKVYNLMTNIALSYQANLMYDSARVYYHKAIRIAPLDSYTASAASFNNLGIFFSETGSPDSARYYYQKALDKLGDPANHITLYAAITDNIAHLDMAIGEFNRPIQTFIRNDSIYNAVNHHHQYMLNKVRLLKALYRIDDPSVRVRIKEGQAYIDQFRDRISENVILEFYTFSNDYFFDKEDRASQLVYKRRYRELEEKLEKLKAEEFQLLANSLLEIQQASLSSEIEAYHLKEEQQKMKLRSFLFTSLGAILCLSLILFSLVVYMRKRRLEHEIEGQKAANELKRKEMEARLLQQDLELKKRDLTNVVLHNTQVYDANQKVIERLAEMTSSKNISQDLRTLLIDLQTQNQISERSIGLQSKIDTVNEEFYEKLRDQFPDLTKSETELCGYIRINLSNKDISVLKNVEASSVKMSKTRLRKKLGITPEEDLYDFIRQI